VKKHIQLVVAIAICLGTSKTYSQIMFDAGPSSLNQCIQFSPDGAFDCTTKPTRRGKVIWKDPTGQSNGFGSKGEAIAALVNWNAGSSDTWCPGIVANEAFSGSGYSGFDYGRLLNGEGWTVEYSTCRLQKQYDNGGDTYTVVGPPQYQLAGTFPIEWSQANDCGSESIFVQNPWGGKWDDVQGTNFCWRRVPLRPKYCPSNNPIYAGTGAKIDVETDVDENSLHPLKFQRRYSTKAVRNGFSGLWMHNWQSFVEVIDPPAGKTLPSTLTVVRRDGTQAYFQTTGAAWVSVTGSLTDTLTELKTGSIRTGWRFHSAEQGIDETFDAAGKLVAVRDLKSGYVNTLTYSDASTPLATAPTLGYLIAVDNNFGRQLKFSYNSAGQLTTVIAPNGDSITYAYDSIGNLGVVTWPDLKSKQYLYENTNFPSYLTGIIDENGARYATYTYDANGMAASTEHAGGAQKLTISYIGPDLTSLTSYPNGSPVESIHGFTRVANAQMRSHVSQPAGSGCADASMDSTFDGNGNLASSVDFTGVLACYQNDLSRNLEAVRVEGLNAATSCSVVVAANASLPAGSRKTSSAWHPTLKLKTRVAAPLSLTTFVYNGQPDPTAGNAVANCAPTAPLLPDGTPIAVLCKRVESATTDSDGHLGFTVPLDPTVSNRTWSYMYNQYGQVLTVKGPRTDVNDTTTYTYYTDATAEHAVGDLQKVRNAAGHETRYTKYDRAGRVLQSIDATGATTDITYKPRGWVESLTVTPAGDAVAQLTYYEYDAVGQLKKVTLPDASSLAYDYDDAHRLTQVTDQSGNKVTYALDNAGNKTTETVTDASGTLVRKITRVFDALGRLQQASGAGQ
jgi:YD repeat-containing protein